MPMEQGPDHGLAGAHHLIDWLDDSVSFIPSFLDDPYAVINNPYEWWSHGGVEEKAHHLVQTPAGSGSPTFESGSLESQQEVIRKRKQPKEEFTDHQQKPSSQNQRRRLGGEAEKEEEPHKRSGSNGKRAHGGKGSGGGAAGNRSKEVRWAEQLLNPCAAAIEAANVSRVQHLLFVLHELASPSGDANHRLASHGLSTLARHLSSAGVAGLPPGSAAAASSQAPSYETTEPRLFRSALIKFHEVSPWFAFPNALANAAILNATKTQPLHIVDIGVSHGVQWPTLLDALTHRPCGAPPLVRLTVAATATGPCAFSSSPPGYDFPSHLLRYAKSIGLNLRIDRVETLRSISIARGETRIVCAQFRGHGGSAEERMAFARGIRELEPDFVVMSEIEAGGGGGGRGGGEMGYAEEFGRKVETLWRFLDSTSAAFKGKDCTERRVVEGEAARLLEEGMGTEEEEGRERWRERMAAVGFTEEGIGEEAAEAGRALLRKYDGNWEMRMGSGAAVGLWWKGHPVSFCSLWKVAGKPGGLRTTI